MGLNGAANVKFAFSFNVSRVCSFGSFKPTKGFVSTINANSGAPFISTTTPVDTEETRPIVTGCVATVLLVYGFGDDSEILDSVIGSKSVDVVDLTFRPNTVNVKPSKSMQCVGFPIKHGKQIPIPIQTAQYVAFGFRSAARDFPNELSRCLIKIYERAQSFCANIWLSHDAPLLLIG